MPSDQKLEDPKLKGAQKAENSLSAPWLSPDSCSDGVHVRRTHADSQSVAKACLV